MMDEGGTAVLRVLVLFTIFSLATKTLHSETEIGIAKPIPLNGFTLAEQPLVVDDYDAWNKFRVFATAIARPSRMSDLRTAHTIQGSDIDWNAISVNTFAKDLADMNVMVGTYSENGDIFFPFRPQNSESCDTECWSEALDRLQRMTSPNMDNPWHAIMFDREYLVDKYREVIVDYNFAKGYDQKLWLNIE